MPQSLCFNKVNAILILLFLCNACSHAPSASPGLAQTGIDPSLKQVAIAPRSQVEARGKKWMISTQGIESTRAAAKIIEQGGTLVDAAIAASFTVSVERPQSTGLGGGGFLIYHEAKTGKNHVLDFRERAPARATKKMFLNHQGEVVENLSVTGFKAVGVPGLVRGMERVHQKWGSKLPWKALLAPAIATAQNGFQIYPSLAHALSEEQDDLKRFDASKAIFFNEDGTVKKEGDLLVQKELSQTLQIIAAHPDDLYTGEIAKKICLASKKNGGILTGKDLLEYQVKEYPAVEADFRGYHVVSMPPPSSGGIHVIQILKLLENDPLEADGFLSSKSLHLEASAMQQAFADRAKYLGDPEFIHVPIRSLISESYLSALRKKFNEERARPSSEVFAGDVPADGPNNTTHLTLMDSEGNVIVSTQTINGWFGSKVVADGTGVVMNNEMDDFAAKPGAKNLYGATATTEANSVAPHKTPLSSMSPTIVLKNGKPVLALGAPGGTRIITAVAQTILNYLVFHQDLYTAIAAPRIHDQWSPDELGIENQPFSLVTLESLEGRGYPIKRIPAQSDVMAIAREGDTLIGVADPRDIGTSRGE